MTREEAKAILYEWQKMMVRNGVPIDTSKVQALRVAIEALQTEQEDEPQFYDEDDYWNGRVPTHGRLIDADALKEREKEFWSLDFNHPKYEDTLEDIIERAPTVSAEAVKGWIPCSERLPSDCGKYLVTQTYIGDGERYVSALWYGEPYPLLNGNENNKTPCWYTSESEGDYELDNVIAWMPLPTPYKGGDTE